MPDDAIEIEYLGLRDDPPALVDYQWAWDYQRQVHAAVSAGDRPARVLLLEHAAVYTAGKQTLPEERPFDGTPVIDVDRGGKITWHGPGQLVGYPIVRLPSRVGVVDHVRRMEQAVIDLLAELGIRGVRVDGRTGVWLPAEDRRRVTGSAATGAIDPDSPLANVLAVPAKPERKICAIGIRVARRTTMHGFAINVTGSTAAFENIIPCGISDAGVTSIAAELGGNAPSVLEIGQMLEPHLRRCLDYSAALQDIVVGS